MATLNADNVADYHDRGVTSLGVLLSDAEIVRLTTALEAAANTRSPGRVFEEDGVTVRALHGCHADHHVFDSLCRLRRLVEPARELLGNDVYVYQFKINMKAAFVGDVWRWHQDYIYWSLEDGMPTPRAITVAIFLDDVTEYNGPIVFVPGSHKAGTLQATDECVAKSSDSWRRDVAATLKYTVSNHDVEQLAGQSGLGSSKGPKGSIVVFHPNLVHASAPNISPFSRRTIYITYNATDNVPIVKSQRRPAFLVNRDTRPIVMTDEMLS